MVFLINYRNYVIGGGVRKIDKTVTQNLAIFLILLSLVTVASHRAYADTIVVAADQWCPYNCDPNSDTPGYVIELLDIIFSAHGHTIKYITLPWKRALEDTRAGIINAAVGAIPKEAPDLIFPETEHGWYEVGFFTMDSNWRFLGEKSVANMIFGTVDGYSYGEATDKMILSGILKIEAVGGDAPLQCNMNKLLYNRIQGIIADKNVFNSVANTINKPNSFYYEGSPSKGEPLYVAFSPQIESSKEYARLYSEGIIKLRKSGEFQKLLAKYGIVDWR